MTCQLFYFSFNWFCHSSVWILTMMTADKAFVIIFPFKAKTFSTAKIAKIVSAITIGFWAIFDSQWMFTVKTVKQSNNNPDGCDYHMSKRHYDYYYTLDSVFYSLVPCSLIFFFNMTIIFKLLVIKFRSKQANQTSALSKSAMSTTLMLLSASITFTILTGPMAVNYVIFLDHYAIEEIGYLSVFLYYTNHACNAVMYTMLSPKFRKEIKKSLCIHGNRVSDENTTNVTGHGNRIGPSETRESHLSASAGGQPGAQPNQVQPASQ